MRLTQVEILVLPLQDLYQELAGAIQLEENLSELGVIKFKAPKRKDSQIFKTSLTS